MGDFGGWYVECFFVAVLRKDPCQSRLDGVKGVESPISRPSSCGSS